MMTEQELQQRREEWRAARKAKRSASAKKAAVTRAARKAVEDAQAASLAPVRAGDIFEASWGYDQTNIDFYEVVEVSASGKSGLVVKIGQNLDRNAGSGADYVTPNRKHRSSEPRRVVFRPSMWRGDESWYFKATECSTAFRWSGNARYQTALGWGH